MAPILLAAPVLLASALLSRQAGWVCALGVVIVLGVPHGALDVEIGRTLLRSRFPRWWFPLFALPYLLLVGLVLLAWHVVPEATLAAFLLASVWHFGTEDTDGGGRPALAWGGLPVAIPVLFQPHATARILSVASGAPLEGIPVWLLACSLAWLVPLGLTAMGMPARVLIRCAALCLAFAVLPPLAAFALYFVGVHAPAHVAALLRHPSRAPRVRNAAAAWRLAIPTTLLTIVIGAATWPVHSGSTADRLLAVTLQLLAALTLPHMVLDTWLDRRDAARATAPRLHVPAPAGRAGRRRPLLSPAALAGSVPLLLSGCGVLDRGFASPAGPIAQMMHDEFLLVCLIMLSVIGPVLLLVPLIAWHYRLTNTKSAYRPQWGFSWSLEGLIWIPPVGIVVLLAVFLWRDTHRLDPYRPLPGVSLEVQAIAADWKWIFIYPEQGVATVNRLVIPAGRPVHFSLTSATVMQTILMPQLAGQIAVMAGMRTQLNLQADRPGSFFGENTQFNGMHFQDEKFAVDAMDEASFARWLATVRAQPNRLDPSEYQTLTRRDVLKQPLAFGAVEPGLFDKVVALQQPSGHALELAQLPPRPMPMGVPEGAPAHGHGQTP